MTEEWIETRIGQAPSWCNRPRREEMVEPEAVAAMLRLTDLGWARNESRVSWASVGGPPSGICKVGCWRPFKKPLRGKLLDGHEECGDETAGNAKERAPRVGGDALSNPPGCGKWVGPSLQGTSFVAIPRQKRKGGAITLGHASSRTSGRALRSRHLQIRRLPANRFIPSGQKGELQVCDRRGLGSFNEAGHHVLFPQAHFPCNLHRLDEKGRL